MPPFSLWQTSPISIHAPRTGSDGSWKVWNMLPSGYFNPRSPHGERRRILPYMGDMPVFQSTLPARGATGREQQRHKQGYFNPRSPHGERPHRN